MNDKIVRNISDDTLNIVISKLNPEFMNELPLSPKELLKYATRRTDPVISENISYSLGQSMLSHRLSDEDYLMVFFQVVHTSFFEKTKSDKKSASVLISQTGAGKTNLTNLILKKDPNIVIINPDLYKKFNPKLQEILQEDPTHLGALTGIDSYDHANNIRNLAIENGYNLLFECAPSQKQGLIGIDLKTLEEHGYDIRFHIMAVGNLLSSMAIHWRYENEINKNPTSCQTKLTDLSRHDDSYKGVETVISLLPSDKISIYRRGTQEERQEPQEITKHDRHIFTQKDIINILSKEREISNRNYIFNAQNSFQEDFNQIKTSMENRNAPEAQFKQLNEIYDRYITYLNYIKYQENNGLCIED